MLRKLLSVSARYGAIGGLLGFVLSIAMYYLGRHPLLTSPFLDFRILLFSIFMFFALKEYRDYEQQGVLYFSEAMIGGLMVIISMNFISSLFLYLFGVVVSDFLTDYITQVTAYVKSFSAEDIERIGKDIYAHNLLALPSTTMLNLMITYFVHGLVIGFFVNIILSVILRKQPKP